MLSFSAGFALVSAAAYSVLFLNAPTIIDLQSPQWVTDFKERLNDETKIKLPELKFPNFHATLPTVPPPTVVTAPIITLPKVTPQSAEVVASDTDDIIIHKPHRAAPKHRNQPARLVNKSASMTPVIPVIPVIKDELHTSTAQRETLPALTEHQRLQGLHEFLFNRFLVATAPIKEKTFANLTPATAPKPLQVRAKTKPHNKHKHRTAPLTTQLTTQSAAPQIPAVKVEVASAENKNTRPIEQHDETKRSKKKSNKKGNNADKPMPMNVAVADGYSWKDDATSDQTVQSNSEDNKDSDNSDASTPPSPADSPSQKTSGEQPLNQAFVEAFDWNKEISQNAVTTQSLDGENGAAGWKVSQTENHVGTVSWVSPWVPIVGMPTNGGYPPGYPNGSGPTPLLSTNNAVLLAQLASVSLNRETGIVHGKIPAGYHVEDSGRHEHAIYLSDDNQVLPPEAIDKPRHFAFLNVAPGAHVLYVTNSLGPLSTDAGNVAIPVLPNLATYVDLTTTTTRKIVGRVLNGSEQELRGVPSVHVAVVGQSAASAITDGAGNFYINNVITISNLPIIVETNTQSGYTHRYRLKSHELNGVTLYRFGSDDVGSWISQLVGGVSSESAIVVGAAPKLVAKHDNQQLYPTITTLAQDATLRPEIYTISDTGAFREKTPLSEISPRFISFQVPEGLAQVSLETQNHQPVWSELMMASPGVINVIGPY